MNFVQPIRDKNKLEEIKNELKKNGTRDYMLFYTGINTGLRISDLLKLNYDDVRNKDGSMKSHISIIEKVGIGIAMGNANQILKSHADYITSSVDENGIYNALQHFIFND